MHFIIKAFCLQTIKDFSFRFEKAFDCKPENETYPVRVSDMIGSTSNQTFRISGKIHISDKMPTNLELEIALTRCSIDKTGCVSFGKMSFPRICEKLTTRTSIAYKIGRAIVPTPQCPFAQGVYEISNSSSYTLNFLNAVSMDGYFWKLCCKFYDKRGSKRFKAVSCVEMDFSFPTKSARKYPR